MGELTVDQLGDRLARGKLGGSYFLKTEDPFLRDEAIALLTESHLAGGSADFDLDQLSGEEVDAAALASVLDTPPMLSRYRVVVIRDAQDLGAAARAVVERAVAQKVEGRVLVVAAEIPRKSSARFFDVLRKECVTVSLQMPRPSELPGWLAKRARVAHGVELDMAAAQLITSAIGSRAGVLAQELEKLVTYVAPAKAIGLAEVRAAVGALPQVDRWEWIDRVAERRIGEALADLPELLDAGESPVALIGAIAESLVRVGLALEGEGALVAALKRDDSFRYLGWKVRLYLQQARQWTASSLAAALEELFRADRLVKSGGLADDVALEEALLRMAALGGGRAAGAARAGGSRRE
jgi:DNA polymerase-3 subunit delta